MFTRDRVFTFKVLVVFLLTQLQRALQRELDDFISQIRQSGSNLERVSKAAFSKARHKLLHGAFIELNRIIVEDFYSDCSFKRTWEGYRLLAVDGSTAEVPNSVENQISFGVHAQRTDGKKICMAQICEIYDPLNNLCIAGKIASFEKSETALFWEMLEEDKSFGKGDIFIFDRYFFSSAMALYIAQRGGDFCFRMKRNNSKVKQLIASGERELYFELAVGKESRAKAKEKEVKIKSHSCRLVKVDLDNGQEEFLLTSLADGNITVEDLKELYAYRWGLEESYKKLKHKVCIENFSGKSTESVYQDYYAKLFIVNLTSMLVQPVDQLLENKPKRKHIHKVNFSCALSKMKFAPVGLFIKKKITNFIVELHRWFLMTTEPVRPGRTYKRKKLPKSKYHQNYKRV